MKRTDLVWIFGAAAVLCACSDSSDGPGAAPLLDTKLAVCVQAHSLTTKAADDPNARAGETNINTLTVLVFDESGSELLGSKTDSVGSTDGQGMITDVPAKTTRVQIAVVANAPAGTFSGVTGMEAFRAVLASLETQRQDNLTMSAPVIVTRSALEADDNYIGFSGITNIDGLNMPLSLTRIAARVDIARIGTRFQGSRLEGRQVQVEGIYLAYAKSTSYYTSDADWGAVEAAGKWVYGAGAAGAGAGVTAGAAAVDYLQATEGWTVSDGRPVKDIVAIYTLENKDGVSPTQVVVKATLLPSGTMAGETRYFTAVINPDGEWLDLDHDYIRRNYIYRLDMTFTESSFSGDDVADADLLVEVKVDPWNTVVMTPDLE